METVDIAQKLYKDGKFEEVLKTISAEYKSFEEMPTEILEMEALSLFRFAQYKKATEAALILAERENLKGLELLAQVTAYVSKDDMLLSNIQKQLPGNLSVCNAYSIRARDADSNISVEKVVIVAIRNITSDEIASVHLLNNTARLLLAKGSKEEDVIMAIGFWQIALMKYGDANYHHRAAVHFWLSKAYERIGQKPLALKSAKKSLALWVKQISLDPNNPNFNKSLIGAEDRIKELS
ncbi:hypothetical protein M0Q50_08380 [bacterium]|jgi:hypothetical protein|nr:hypothetical protein [bacterium]